MTLLHIDPLNHQSDIVKDGKPTALFVRQWQGLIKVVQDTASALAAAIAAQATADAALPKALANTHVFVGNASNLATDVAMSGDTTIANTGAVTIGANKVQESKLDLADNTTFDSSTSKHGFLKKLDNSSAHFMDGQGNWSTPSGTATAITVKDEGSNITTALASLDFVGAGVTATNSSDNVTVTITSGGAGTSGYEWNPDDCNWTGLNIGPDGRSLYNGYTGGTYGAVRGIQSRASGKYYFEFIVGDVHSPAPACGVGSSSATLQNYAGSDANAWAMWADGNGRHSGLTTGGSSYVKGDIIGVAVDFTASTGGIVFYKNNTSNVIYGSLTLGTMYPIATLQTNTTINNGKLALKASEQTYSPPAGYSVWL